MTEASAVESASTRAIVYVLSVAVCALVAVVLYAFPGRTEPAAPGVLPTLNAVLNGSAAVFLTLGYAFIRRRQVRTHRACMLVALVLSSAFLVSYLMHHAQVGSVPFRGQGALRTVYFAILIPHVLLAAVMVPMALFTVLRAFKGNFAAHRRVAKVTLPIWLYVSASGVVLYLMLYHLGT